MGLLKMRSALTEFVLKYAIWVFVHEIREFEFSSLIEYVIDSCVCERSSNIDSDGAMSAFWSHLALKSIIVSPDDEQQIGSSIHIRILI